MPDDIFFAMLSERVFPVGNFIRRRDQLDYLEAPDCFHDMFGHIPMLAHHDFAEMVGHVGRLGVAAIAAGEGERVARIYWHSVEFGLAREGGALKILGAGLASSFGEAHFSLESETVERLPFSVERAVHTPYRHDAFQPRYLVSASLDETIAEVLALDEAKLLGTPGPAAGLCRIHAAPQRGVEDRQLLVGAAGGEGGGLLGGGALLPLPAVIEFELLGHAPTMPRTFDSRVGRA